MIGINIHLDQKSDIRKFEKVQTYQDVTMTKNRHSIFWGGWSMVEEMKDIKVWNNSKSDLEEIRKARMDGNLFIRKVRSNVSNELIDMFDKNNL